MATVLLSDDEYNHIQGLAEDLFSRIEHASPRAATHYASIAKLHADFIANEDAKRAKSQKRASNRERIQKAKESRRNRVQGAGAQKPPSSGTSRPGASGTAKAS